MISRHNLATEIKIRQCVQRAIVIVQNRLVNESIKRLSEEIELRDILQDIILEVATDPHESTGLNKLDTLLKNIIPVLEEAYKSLTTDQAQRDSFRAHILHAIRNALAPVDAAENATMLQPRTASVSDLAVAEAQSASAPRPSAELSAPPGGSHSPTPSILAGEGCARSTSSTAFAASVAVRTSPRGTWPSSTRVTSNPASPSARASRASTFTALLVEI